MNDLAKVITGGSKLQGNNGSSEQDARVLLCLEYLLFQDLGDNKSATSDQIDLFCSYVSKESKIRSRQQSTVQEVKGQHEREKGHAEEIE